MPPAVPVRLSTPRLLLRCWSPGDAASLLPVLEANVAHLQDWIPRHVASPAPLEAITRRLADFAAAFEENREWRYGLFSPDEDTVLGEVSLFPRAASGRVPLPDADRLEIGYWLRSDATGRGYVTEAAHAMVGLATAIPGARCVEIRCDARNIPSAAVPRRLGFHLAETTSSTPRDEEPDTQHQVWAYQLASG